MGKLLFKASDGGRIEILFPKGNSFFLDIPEVNPHAVALVQKKRMQKVFETARMYNKKIPEIPIERVFGVTSFEMG